ncbi:MAG: TonB-dependent receptor [Caulobacterales bacterium]|nr:TonB-dependent receptor [Caulobacterales bacterium]MCA0371958.1 TonB-dependent receptor [Pseudomonadota bacterium]
MPKNNKSNLRNLLIMAAGFSLYSLNSYAQNGETKQEKTNYKNDKDSGPLIVGKASENIIITSSPTRTFVFDTPYSVSKINSKTLNDNRIKNAQDLTQIIPSLQFPQSESALSVTARIRGIGTQGTNVGLEPSVGIMIDGIMRSRTAAGFGDLGELSSIEVARGPQSSYYGANTSAGLIYVSSKKPTFDFESKSFLTFGNLNYQNWGASINGGLSEKLAGRLFFTAAKRDGYMIVNQGLSNERRDNNINYYSSRGQLYYWNGQTEFRLIADYTKRNEACCNAPVFISDSRAPVNSTIIINRIFQNGKYSGNQFSQLRAYADRPFDQTILDKGLSLEINHDYGFAKLKSITSGRYFDFAYAQDGEWSGADILYRDLAMQPGAKVKDFSQELRLYNDTKRFKWEIGALYNHQIINSHNVFQYGKDYETYIGGLLFGAAAATIPVTQYNINLRNLISNATSGLFNSNSLAMVEGGGWSDYFTQKSDNFSLYGRGEYEIFDGTNIIIGVRYIKDKKDFSANYNTSGANGCRAIEQTYGYNPSANAPTNLAGVVGTVCVPWARSALDGFNHKQSFDDDNFAGNFTIKQKINRNLNAYISYNRGVKSGGFNLDRVMQDSNGSIVSGTIGNQIIRSPNTSFEAETVDAYELGLKGKYFSGFLEFGIAFFKQDFQNFQLNTYNGISQIVASVPEVNSKGFEIDYRYLTPIEGLRISGGIAYADTKYGNDLGEANDSNSFLGQNLNLYLIKGRQLTASPKWSVSNNINYMTKIDNHYLDFNLNHRHTSSYNGGSNLDPRKNINALDLYNGAIEIKPDGAKWSLSLWGKNLSNEHYAQIIFDGPLQGNSPLMAANGTTRAVTSQLDGFPAEPRTYGITLRLWK